MLAVRWRAVFTTTTGGLVATAPCFAGEDDALWYVALMLDAPELAALIDDDGTGVFVLASVVDVDADAWVEAVEPAH